MSRCTHEQHSCKLRRLPRCSRCKMEFILVAANYDNPPKTVTEWECPKCHKVVAKELLKEEPLTEWESFLSQWCEKNNKWEKQIKKIKN